MHLVKIKTKIQKFNKVLSIEGDKSLSIRWALIASQSEYKSKSENLLLSEDVTNTLRCLKKLGVKIKKITFLRTRMTMTSINISMIILNH